MEKKKKIPFDKLDITTATDDDIIRSGIRHNTTKDKVCFFVMFIIVALAFLPIILRIYVPKKDTTIEREIVYNNIKCYKTIVRDGYELHTTIDSNYRNGQISVFKIDFNYFKRINEADDNYVFAEIHEFEQLKFDGITSKTDTNSVSFNVDFENYPNLKKNAVLQDYSRYSVVEVNYLINDKGFSCSTETETKMEVVDIETGKKVK